MKRTDYDRLVQFLHRDPSGFMSALVNTCDTYVEERLYSFPQAEREPWLLEFLISHDNLEHSDLED